MKSHTRKLATFTLLAYTMAMLWTAGCRPVIDSVHAAERVDPRLVESNTWFAFDLFHGLRQESPDNNIFISPASVSLALAMTFNGAGGDTAAAMADVLRFHDMSREEINAAFADLRTILVNPDPKVQLAIANSLWFREGEDFNDDFLQRNRDFYMAQIEALDFSRDDAAATINRWVEQQTNNKIKDLIAGPIDPMSVLFLINAIYFKADWQEPFDPKLTREIKFTLPNGSRINHPVMFRNDEFRYLDGEGFQAVALPYGKNGRLSMYVFLPDEGQDLDNFYNNLSSAAWDNWQKSFAVREGLVGLPRFSFEYESSLNNVLSSLGMGIVFDEGAADFSGMRSAPPNLFIAEVKHKSFVEVNEKGTEAAAATSVEIRVTSAPMNRFELVADRPFFFSIVDDKTGSILFMGTVNDPQ
jgi:serine protease inhibitor